MPEPPPASEIAALLRGEGLLPVARRLLADRPRTVTYARQTADGDAPGEITFAYGAGVDTTGLAYELRALAERDPGALQAVCPVPAPGSADRPGSWGVEDLGAVLAARACLPAVPWVRPDWHRLGPSACQIALAFGANDWVLPADDRSDPDHLAAAVGWRAVRR